MTQRRRFPFSVAGLRFEPRGVQQVSLHTGEPLRLVFQLWSKPAAPATREGHKIKIHYVLGTMEAGGEAHQEDEEIDAGTLMLQERCSLAAHSLQRTLSLETTVS